MVGYAPMAQALTLVNYVMPIGRDYPCLKILWEKILKPISIILEGAFMEELLWLVKANNLII